MSTPPTLSTADQARVTAILEAVTVLNQTVTTVSNQTGVPKGVLGKTVVDNVSQPGELAAGLTQLLHRRAMMRAIWAKLSPEERSAVGLTQEG